MTARQRIVYAGTPEFAVPALNALVAADYNVVAVYTQPDRPAGRGRTSQPSAVKQAAVTHGIAVYQPESLKTKAAQQSLANLEPDLMVVTAYGLILPPAILAIPRLGCINIHASLLPRWRGAAPIQHAILAGDNKTGITIMQMDEGLDTGAMLATKQCAIEDDETAAQLHDKLMHLGAKTLTEMLPAYFNGEIKPQLQTDADACYASKISKQEAEINWALDAKQLQRCVRAYNAWPVAYTGWQGKNNKPETLRIWQAQALTSAPDADHGTVIASTKDGIDVATGQGVLRMLEVQPAGKRRMSAADFINAHEIKGQVLG